MRRLMIAGALMAMTGAVAVPAPDSPAAAQAASSWAIGPMVRGRNYSVGMPPVPRPARDGLWSFDFPFPNRQAGHVHAVTTRTGSLLGARRIVMRYRIEAERGVRFHPQEAPGQPGIVSLYFQRRGDNWSARGRYEHYRWYAPPATVRTLAPGTYEMVVDLADPGWSSVMGARVARNRQAFAAALAQPDHVGIALGGGPSRAHGVYATGPARFTLLDFRIL